jgi:hypothetical protein
VADGFLGRWSRRKQEVREGKPLAEQMPPSPQPSPASRRGSQPESLRQALPSEVPQVIRKEGDLVSPPLAPAGEGRGEGTVKVPAPTLDDVQALTAESDFKPFMAREVDPEVKNAAMKKLFADPHYNVMDGLDTYIDDYSKPDPLPESMLRKMVSAKFLNLFDDEDEKTGTGKQTARDNAGPLASPVPQAASPTEEPAERLTERPAPSDPVPTAGPQPKTEDHAHTDLRLQQDHATGAAGSGRGPE